MSSTPDSDPGIPKPARAGAGPYFAPGETTVLCRNCGVVFARKYGACPACGTPRPHKRPRKPLRELRERVEARIKRGWRWVRRKRRYFVYVPVGVAASALLALMLERLLEPKSDRAAIVAGETPGSGTRVAEATGRIAHGIGDFFGALWRWFDRAVIETVVERPVLFALLALGAVIGAFIAWRGNRARQHRRRAAHRHKGSGASVPDRAGPRSR